MFDLFSFPEAGPKPDDREGFLAAAGKAFNRIARSTGPGLQVGQDGLHQDDPPQPFVFARVTEVTTVDGVNRHGWQEVAWATGNRARADGLPGGFVGGAGDEQWAAHPDNQAVRVGRFVLVARDGWGRWLLLTPEDVYDYAYGGRSVGGLTRIQLRIPWYTCSGSTLTQTVYTHTFGAGAPLVVS